MTTYFFTRHPSAINWAREHQIESDQHLLHLDTLSFFYIKVMLLLVHYQLILFIKSIK